MVVVWNSIENMYGYGSGGSVTKVMVEVRFNEYSDMEC